MSISLFILIIHISMVRGLGHTPIFKEIIELGIDSPGSLPLFLLGKNFVSSICRVRVSESFVNQATPRFEQGRKDS